MLTKIRAAIIVILVAAVAIAGYEGYRLFTEAAPAHTPEVSHATGTTADGWQLVTYRGLDLEVPAEWTRRDTRQCKAMSERWSATDQNPCADTGLVFLTAASFDPADGPGVHRAAPSNWLPDGGFNGYVTRGDVVVVVTDPSQAVVRRILQSVSEVV